MDNPFLSWTMRGIAPAAILYFMAHVGFIAAEPLGVTGTVSGRFTDNANKSQNEESGTEMTTRVRVKYSRDEGRCTSDLDASLGYSYWVNELYDPETRAAAGFDGNCEITEGLNWELIDNLSEVLQSSRQNDTPDNRTRKNIFRTGPLLTLPLSRVDQLRTSLQYENTEYEDPENQDSDRYIGSLAWNHQFAVTFSGGLSATADHQELDSGAETDSRAINLNLNKAWATTTFSGSVGYSEQEVTFGALNQTNDGVVGSLRLTRELNPTASFFFSASRQLTDQASDFTIQFQDVEFDYREQSGIEVTAIESGLDKQFGDGTQFGGQLFFNRSDYLQIDEQEDAAGLRLRLSRSVTPRLRLNANGGYEYRRYENASQNDQLASASVGLSYQLSADLDCTASLGYSQRDSDLPSSEYTENWAQLGLSYRFR